MRNLESVIGSLGLVWILFWTYTAICWVVNLIQLFGCDFESPWKQEIIKGVGVFVFPTAGFTVWY